MNDIVDVWDHGGILVSMTLGIPAGTTLVPVPPSHWLNPDGRPYAVRTTFRGGMPVTVGAAISPFREGITWYEKDTTGTLVQFSVEGEYPAKQLFEIAASLRPGIPPDELTVVPAPPPLPAAEPPPCDCPYPTLSPNKPMPPPGNIPVSPSTSVASGP